jgi:hypothetical protein
MGIDADCRNKKGLSMGNGDNIEGFCGISRRRGMKPIIAAVNGYAFGTTSTSSHFTKANMFRRRV